LHGHGIYLPLFLLHRLTQWGKEEERQEVHQEGVPQGEEVYQEEVPQGEKVHQEEGVPQVEEIHQEEGEEFLKEN
jgi:hypothetical protein